jgi:L-lysine exporter family protein LysE/ArgO
MHSLLAGFGLGLSLIIAIGAQNVYVLRQGIRRDRVLTVVLICAISDAILILVGVAGLGALLEAAPWLIDAARWLGALFLIGYGLLAARRAWQGGEKGMTVESDGAKKDATKRSSLASVALTTLALTWLNPHVYLDTVLLLGSIAATHGDARWLFAGGAVVASLVWFSGLGFGARYLGRWLTTPRAWRFVDAGIAVVMIAIAIGLIIPIFTR